MHCHVLNATSSGGPNAVIETCVRILRVTCLGIAFLDSVRLPWLEVA